MATYNYNDYRAAAGIDTEFVQDNQFRFQRELVRGLHFRSIIREDKLVLARAVKREVFGLSREIQSPSGVEETLPGKWFGCGFPVGRE